MILVDVCRPNRTFDEITNVCLAPLRGAIGEFPIPVSPAVGDEDEFLYLTLTFRIYAICVTLIPAFATIVGALCWWIDSLIHRDLYQIRETNYLAFKQFLDSFPALLRCKEIVREAFCSESPIEKVYLETYEPIGNSLGPMLSCPMVQSAKEVFLSSNSLTEVPAELEQFVSLEALKLSRNEIRTLPAWLCNLPNLNHLDVSDNLIEEIPPEFAMLPSRCTIIARGCGLSTQQCELFQSLIETVRRANPALGPNFYYSIYGGFPFENYNGPVQFEIGGPPGLDSFNTIDVSSEIDRLKTEFSKSKFGMRFQVDWQRFKDLLLGMERDGKLAAYFFGRLTAIADYCQPGIETKNVERQKNVIWRFDQIASKMVEDSTFRKTACGVIQQGVDSCSDRIDLYFSKLEEEVLLANASNLSDKELVKLCVGVNRRKLLQEYAEQLAKEKRYGDPLETVLAFERGLKEALALPGLGQGMLYERCSNVTPELLSAGKQKILDQTETIDQKIEILLEKPCWLGRLRSKFPTEFDELDDEAIAAKTKEQEVDVAIKSRELCRKQTQKLLSTLK